MEVTILKGQKTATDLHGNVYEIERLKIVRQQTNETVYYPTDDKFFKVACAENTKSKANLLSNGNIELL
jgi:hypothetical protein